MRAKKVRGNNLISPESVLASEQIREEIPRSLAFPSSAQLPIKLSVPNAQWPACKLINSWHLRNWQAARTRPAERRVSSTPEKSARHKSSIFNPAIDGIFLITIKIGIYLCADENANSFITVDLPIEKFCTFETIGLLLKKYRNFSENLIVFLE